MNKKVVIKYSCLTCFRLMLQMDGANVFGFSNGTAKCGFPKVRLATYNVCRESTPLTESRGCFDVDIMATFDMTIHEGVDVFSISLGDDHPAEYMKVLMLPLSLSLQRIIPIALASKATKLFFFKECLKALN